MPTTSSFIPKTTLPKPTYKAKGAGFLVTISIIIFLISGGVAGGIFLYKGLLAGEVDGLRDDLSKIQKEFELVSIRNFSRTADSISLAKSIIESHIAVSNIFKFLEDSTLPDVRFLNLNYVTGENNVISMSGEAPSYTTLAEQAFVFESNPLVSTLSLSNLSLRKGGKVGFSVSITIDTELIRYQPTTN